MIVGLACTFILANVLCAESGNLIRNASFEEVGANGLLREWTVSHGGLKPGAPKPAVVVRCAAGGTRGEREGQLSRPDAVAWVLAQQLVHRPLTAGEEYVLSVWLKADRPAEVDLYLAAVPAVEGARHQGRRVRRKIGRAWE